MAANVDHEFLNYFEIDEEKLRRVYSVIKNRINSEQDKDKLVFSVTRNDNLIYSTENINDVVSETNDSISKINNLDVLFKSNSLDLIISFNVKHGTKLKISGEDRDNVFLLSSELKEYISKEVTTIKKLWWIDYRYFMPLLMLAALGLASFNYSKIQKVDNDKLQAILNNNITNDKLNFLIELYTSTNSNTADTAPWLLLFMLVMILSILPFRKITDYIFPKNIFLFGKEIEVIKRRRKILSNIFWTVIVGGALTLLLTFIATKFIN